MRRLAWSYLAGALLALALAPAIATEWPKSDIAPDPALRRGVLPNGMRYVILQNHTPAGAVSVRFSIAVGSTYEAPAERGFSHFVEHMAFRGSKNFPDGELNHSLERLGLRFGPDTNASTGQYATTYMFNLPKGDSASIADALAISRDIAGDISFEPKAVETEAGVVMSEAAMRGGPSRRAGMAELQFELGDPRASALPGGETGMVLHPTAADLRRFYQAYYQPDRAILTVVGDVDPDQLEAQIANRFQDWKAQAPVGSRPVFSVPMQRGLEAKVHVEAEAPLELELTWVRPPVSYPIDRAGWRRLHIRAAVLQVVNRRLSAMAAGADRPFLSAQAGDRDARGAAELSGLSADYDGGTWQKALDALVQTRLALLRNPVSQAEIDSVVAAQKAGRQRAVLSAGTRSSSALASSLAAAAVQDDISVSPAQVLTASEENLRDLTPEVASQALMEMFGGEPLIFVSSRQPLDQSAVLEAYHAATENSPSVSVPAASVKWPYTDFGAPGRVVETSTAADLGVTSLRFANNVHLLVRPSKLRANQVVVSVKIGQGRLSLSKDKGALSWMAGGMTQSGLGALTPTEMTIALSGKAYRMGFGMGDNAFAFNGETTPQDLETQLQIFAAYIKDPGFRTAGFEQFKQRLIGRIQAADATPSGTMGLYSSAILHGGDPRWAVPKTNDVRAATVEQLKSLLTPLLAQGPIEVVVAGDITVDEAKRAVGLTLGALPRRPLQLHKVTAENDIRFPPGEDLPTILKTSAPANQSIANIAWATHGFYTNPVDDAALSFLASILRARLLDDVRGQGLSYSVSVSQAASTGFDFGYFSASATMPPGKAQLFYQSVDRVVADLKDGHISADEFARSRIPTLEEYRRATQNNEYWAALLATGWDQKVKFERARTFQHLLENVTPADVMAVARKYLVPARMLKISAGA